MELLEWKESLAVGFAEIDAQHRELVERANLFFANVGDAAGRRGLWTAFRHFDRFVRLHFVREERTMRWLGYPGMVEHRTEHREFLGRVDAIRRHLESGGTADAALLALGEALRDGLVEHIRTADRKVAAYADSAMSG
jgi:hemerythrin-like metal-binding protein